MIELGFVSNPDDEKLLLSDDWRQKMAALGGRARSTPISRSSWRSGVAQ